MMVALQKESFRRSSIEAGLAGQREHAVTMDSIPALPRPLRRVENSIPMNLVSTQAAGHSATLSDASTVSTSPDATHRSQNSPTCTDEKDLFAPGSCGITQSVSTQGTTSTALASLEDSNT